MSSVRTDPPSRTARSRLRRIARPAARGPLRRQRLHELRLRPGAGVVVGHLVVDGMLRLEREPVEVHPLAADVRREDPEVLVAPEAMANAARPGLSTGRERQRIQEPVAAEAHVGQACSLRQLDPQQHVGAGPHAAHSRAYARRQRNHAEPQALQDGLEQRVLLEAVASASAGHDLGLQRSQVERDGPAQQDVEVLERDRRHVRCVQRGQRVERRLARSNVADAREVRIEVEVRHASEYLMRVPLA